MAQVQAVEVGTINEDGTIASSYVAVNDDGTVNESITLTPDENGNLTAATQPGSPYVAVICGLVTLAVVMLCSVYGKKMARLIPFIIGILAGYLVATIFYFIGKATGNAALMVIDYSALRSCRPH